MKKKVNIAISTIILNASVTYLIQHWYKHSGLEDKVWNKYDDFKNVFKGDSK